MIVVLVNCSIAVLRLIAVFVFAVSGGADAERFVLEERSENVIIILRL